MYPFVRMAKEFAIHRSAPRLGLFDTHVSHHICWPWDIDLWLELNNGRTLTLFDLGRMVLFRRTGILDVMRQRRWGGTVAGASVRYRRRVAAFDRIEMRSRIAGWDERFFYLDQSMWRDGDCTGQALVRSAVVTKGRMVPMAEAAGALGHPGDRPDLPRWIAAWAQADALRPWPPEA